MHAMVEDARRAAGMIVTSNSRLYQTQRAAAEFEEHDRKKDRGGQEPVCGCVFTSRQVGCRVDKLPCLIVSKCDTIGDIKAFITINTDIPPDRQSLKFICHPRKGEASRKQINTSMRDNDLVSMCNNAKLLPWFRVDCEVVDMDPIPAEEDDLTIDVGSPRRKTERLSPAVPAEAEQAGNVGSPRRKWARLSPAVPAEAEPAGNVGSHRRKWARLSPAVSAEPEAAGDGDSDLVKIVGDGEPSLRRFRCGGLTWHDRIEGYDKDEHGKSWKSFISNRVTGRGTDAEAQTPLQMQSVDTASANEHERVQIADKHIERAQIKQALEVYRTARNKSDKRRRGNATYAGSKGCVKAEQLGIPKCKATAGQSLLESVHDAATHIQAAVLEFNRMVEFLVPVSSCGEDAENVRPPQEAAAAPQSAEDAESAHTPKAAGKPDPNAPYPPRGGTTSGVWLAAAHAQI